MKDGDILRLNEIDGMKLIRFISFMYGHKLANEILKGYFETRDSALLERHSLIFDFETDLDDLQ